MSQILSHGFGYGKKFQEPRSLRRRVLLNALRPLGRILGVRFELSRHRHGGDEPAFGDGMEQDGFGVAIARYEPFGVHRFRRERGDRRGTQYEIERERKHLGNGIRPRRKKSLNRARYGCVHRGEQRFERRRIRFVLRFERH